MTLHLRPETQAKLAAIAAAHGLSADDYLESLVEREILIESPEAFKKKPTRSLRGLLAKYGPAPSAEEIDQNRAEIFADFPRSDF